MNESLEQVIERIAGPLDMFLQSDELHLTKQALRQLAAWCYRDAAQACMEKAKYYEKPPTDRANLLIGDGHKRASAMLERRAEEAERHG